MFGKSKPDPRDAEILYLRTQVSDLYSQLAQQQSQHTQALKELAEKLTTQFLQTLRPPRVSSSAKLQEAEFFPGSRPDLRSPDSSYQIRPGRIKTSAGVPIFGQMPESGELASLSATVNESI